MSKIFFQHFNFRTAARNTIDHCNVVIEEYLADGFRLTLRQLYYQLVSRGIIPNEEREYKKLGRVLSNARLAGEVDWDAIEDRTRRPVTWQQHDNLRDAVEDTLRYYRLPRLVGQSTYVELWVEKDALAGVLRPIASQYHVTLMVNRGYSSSSAMYEAAQRIDYCVDQYGSEDALVIYLGDLDPSGEDMVRDVNDRLGLFADSYVKVQKLALTIDQVNKHKPPPNPTKLKDTRAKAFIREFGYESWEVDALPPKELRRLIENAFSEVLDLEKIEAVKAIEKEDKARLRSIIDPDAIEIQ